MTEGHLAFDVHGILQSINPSAAETLGYSDDDLHAGLTFAAILAGSRPETTIEGFLSSYGNGDRHEILLKDRDGNPRLVSAIRVHQG